MKLNLVLVLSAFFAYSDCMNLSNASQTSILGILHNHSDITDPKDYMASVDGLGRAFNHVDEQGSIQLAEAFVRAYKDGELSENEIQNLMKEAVRVGNINAYAYISKNIHYSNFDVLEIAATSGKLDIMEQEFATIGQDYYAHKNDFRIITSAAIQAGHLHVLRWLSGKGVLYTSVAKNIILEALETGNQDIIDYLLQAQIYTYHYYPYIRITFKGCLRYNSIIVPDSVCREAARIGNMGVVSYYFDENLPISRSDLERAQIAAYKADHTEIKDLIGNRILENLQLLGEIGALQCPDVTEALIAALEVNNQKVIDYLLHEQIYPQPWNTRTRLAYKDRMKFKGFSGQDEVFIKAAEFGNMNVVRYFFDKKLTIKRSDFERAQIAAYKAGQTEISALIGQWVLENLRLNSNKEFLLCLSDVENALIAALEGHNQRVIDYLLHEPIYPQMFNIAARLTYESLFRFNYFGHKEIFMKAAEVGNMEVFQYYFEREFFKDENYLREVQQIAGNNDHNDIADLISTMLMF